VTSETMSTNDLFPPFLYQVGLGGIGGFLVGYAVKKIIKILAVLIGAFIVFILYLGYIGVLNVNYDKLTDFVEKAMPYLEKAPGFLLPMISSLPFAGSFLLGFALGLKKG